MLYLIRTFLELSLALQKTSGVDKTGSAVDKLGFVVSLLQMRIGEAK